MYHHRKNIQIKLTHYDDTKKMAYDSHIVRAKENLKLSTRMSDNANVFVEVSDFLQNDRMQIRDSQ